MNHLMQCLGCLALTFLVAAGASALSFNQNVTPDVIYGSGNANGSWTVDRSNGVELGLRGKLRHNAAGAPENTFNSNGNGTYSFAAGVAPTQPSRRPCGVSNGPSIRTMTDRRVGISTTSPTR